MTEIIKDSDTDIAAELQDRLDALLAAPGGARHARHLLVDMAVRGLFGTRGKASEVPTDGSPQADRPFALPSRWEWSSVGALTVKLGAGSTPLGGKKVYRTSGVMFLRSQNVWDEGLRLDDVAYISSETHEDMKGTWVEPGDVLLNITGASIGRSTVVPDELGDANVSQHVAIVRLGNKSMRRFIHLWFTSPSFQRLIMDAQVGVSREGLSMKRLRGLPVPLPPLAEQEEIVRKVDELIALCSELEQAEVRCRLLGARSVAATLKALPNGDKEPGDTDHGRLSNHFHHLFVTQEDVALLRQTVVDLAFRGRLTPRRPAGTPVSELFASILAARGDRPAEVGTSPVEPFPIPANWCWVRWGDLTLSTGSGWSPQCLPRPRGAEEWGVLKVSAVSWGRFAADENKALPASTSPREEFAVREGDFLMSRANTSELVGRSVVVEGAPQRLILSDKIVRCEFAPGVEKQYVNFFNRTAAARAHYVAHATGTSDSMKNISRDVILDMPVPLAPVEEQQEVVAVVERLLQMCDALEHSIERSERAATSVAEALVARGC